MYYFTELAAGVEHGNYGPRGFFSVPLLVSLT